MYELYDSYMNENDATTETEVPMSEARTHLPELVNQVAYRDDIIYLTRRGKRLAAIVPAGSARTVDDKNVSEIRHQIKLLTDEAHYKDLVAEIFRQFRPATRAAQQMVDRSLSLMREGKTYTDIITDPQIKKYRNVFKEHTDGYRDAIAPHQAEADALNQEINELKKQLPRLRSAYV